jgi:hypothetical protein
MKIPTRDEIRLAIAKLDREIDFEVHPGFVDIKGEVTQEEFSFLLSCLKCPINVTAVQMQGLYYGSIFEGQDFVA